MYTLRQLRKRTAHDHLVRQLGEPFLFYEETKEYFWSILDLTLGRDSWHHIRRLSIRQQGAVTFRGTYRYEPYTQSGGKWELFLEGALV